MKTKSDDEAVLVLDNILNGLTLEDVWKMEFNLIEETKEFYNLFAKVIGFSIRNDDVKNNY